MEIDPRRAAGANRLTLDLLERAGEAVITPGPRELDRWDEFAALMSDRKLEVVCSNVWREQDGERLWLAPRSLVRTIDGVRVGLLGVLGVKEYGALHPSDGRTLAFQDPVEAIAELAPALRAEVEIVIVLACVNDADAVAIAKKVHGVDVLIGGYQSISSARPLQVGELILNRSGQWGQYLGVTRLIVSPQGEIIDWGGVNVVLGSGVPSDARADSLVRRLTGRAGDDCSGQPLPGAGAPGHDPR